jgi:hypothetical protein
MGERERSSGKTPQHRWLSRRDLVRGAAGAALGTGLLHPKFAYANGGPDDHESAACVGPQSNSGGRHPSQALRNLCSPQSAEPRKPASEHQRSVTDHRFRWIRRTDAHSRGRDRNRHVDWRDYSVGLSG